MMIRQRVLAFGAMLLLTVGMTSATIAQQPTLTAGSGFIARNSGDADVKAIPEFVSDALVPTTAIGSTTVSSTVSITATDVAFIDNGGNIVNTFFTIEGLTHSHASDLTVRVDFTGTGANAGINRTATLFERVGITDTNNNSSIDNQNADGTGSNANFSGSYRFQDGSSSTLFTAAANTADTTVVPTLNANNVVYSPSGAGGNGVSLFGAFAGNGSLDLQDVVGNYTFTISDRSNQTTNANTLVPPNNLTQSFTRTNVAFQAVNTIPEPGTATAILFGMIGFAARRRRA